MQPAESVVDELVAPVLIPAEIIVLPDAGSIPSALPGAETAVVPLKVPEPSAVTIPPLPSAPPPPIPPPSGQPAPAATINLLGQLRDMNFQDLHEHFRQDIATKLNDPLWGIPKDRVRDVLKLNSETGTGESSLPIQTGEEDKSTPAPPSPRPQSLIVPLLPSEPETDEERRRQAEQWNKVKRLFVPPMSTMGGWMLWRNIQENQYFVLQEHKVQYWYRMLVKANNFSVVQAQDLPSIMLAWSFLESIRNRCEEAGIYLEPIRTIKFFIMVYELARSTVDDIAKAIDPLLFAMQFDLTH